MFATSSINADHSAIVADATGVDVIQQAQEIGQWLETNVREYGAVLLRQANLLKEGELPQFISNNGLTPLTYEFASTPRSRVEEGVYTSTEYPPEVEIPLHSEQAYTNSWPMRIWFNCNIAPSADGETPIADTQTIYRKLDPAIVKRFEDKKLSYVRNYRQGIDVSWQQSFSTDDKSRVEQYCRDNNIEFNWLPCGGLKTRQFCQSVLRHPFTGKACWFNQAHLFHCSAIPAEIRGTLLDMFGEDGLPRNVYYGDGSAIEDSVIAEINGVFNECKIVFPWQSGDLLLLDNLKYAHGRHRFSGQRKITVAMTHFDGIQNY